MNTIAEITSRLKVQARGTDTADCSRNLADYVWMAKHQRAAPAIDDIWEALLLDFEHINNSLRTREATEIDRALVYAVNGLLVVCMNELLSSGIIESCRSQLNCLAWRIITAWDAILAGDIDSIQGHVEMEESVRLEP